MNATMRGRNFVRKILAGLLYAMMLLSCVNNAMAVQTDANDMVMITSITLDKTALILARGDSYALTATLEPADANEIVAFKSSEPSVASVDESGVVTALIKGEAVVTAYTQSGIEAVCSVTVKNILISSLKLNKASATIGITGSLQLMPAISPSNASNTTIKWSSSKTSVAIVNEDGLVTPRKAGVTTITAAATDGSGKRVTCKVTVKEIRVTSFELKTPLTIHLKLNDTFQLAASVSPNNADYPQVTWTSSNPEVAKMKEDGLVTAASKGFAIITAKCDKGRISKKCIVMVDMPGDVNPGDIFYHASSPTLKVIIENKSKYFITRIWAANPYAQFNKYASSDYGKVCDSIVDILNMALSKNKLNKKIAVGVNSDVSVKFNSSTANDKWGNEYTCYSKIIHQGKVLRDDPHNNSPRMLTYGLSRSGELMIYYIGANTPVKERKAIHAQMDADGIRNTYGAMTALIDHGRVLTGADNVNYSSDRFWENEKAVRNVFGQIDQHNFIYVTTKTRQKVSGLPKLMKDLECQTAVLLDSGGSTTLLYKNRSNATWNCLVGSGARKHMWAVAYWTE